MLVNGFALVPFTLLQAIGRTDITAKLHIVELPLFVVALTTLVGAYGVVGASVAWSLRVLFDGACLMIIARRMFPELSRQFAWLALSAGIGATGVVAAGQLESTMARVGVAFLVLFATAVELYRRGGVSWLLTTIQAYR